MNIEIRSLFVEVGSWKDVEAREVL